MRQSSALETLPAASKFNLAGVVTTKTKGRGRGDTGLFQGSTIPPERQGLGGRYIL